MNKEVLKEEKEYLNKVEKQIKKNIDFLSAFLNSEKERIQQEKFEMRSTYATKEDVDDTFLDIYAESLDFEEKEKERTQLLRMQKNPYFARVDVKENNSKKQYYNYIGYRSLTNDDGGFYVIDWRAPFASLFYDYDKGNFSYNTVSGTVSGEILNKRQFKIENEELKYYFDADIKVDDDILQETLSGTTNEKMKNIVATIQREQNQIIRCSEKFNTFVLGVAGSGKTSIALHRVAYLLYKLKGKLKSSEVLILSPNDMFSAYISEVLPDLNEDNALNTTFEQILKNELGENVIFETKLEQVQRKILGKFPVDEEKNSYAFLVDLYNFLIKFASTSFKPTLIRLGNYNIPESKIAGMYFKSYSKVFPYKRIEWIIENLIETFFSNFKKLEFKLQEFLRAKLYRMFTNNNPINLYKKFLSSKNKKFTLINGKIKYEDVCAILLIHFFIYGSIDYTSFKHVVIDEAQDYNAIQLFILNSYFNCPKTIVGDVGQSLNVTSTNDTISHINEIFSISNAEHQIVDVSNFELKEIKTLNLTKSYRSSYQITTLANSILNRTDCEAIKRVGQNPELCKISSKSGFVSKFKNLFESYKQKGYNNIGIITKTLNNSKELFDLLHPHFKDIKLITNTEHYLNGVVVLDAFSSKGLEFDAVIVFNANTDEYNSELDRQLLYIAVTRALHDVCLIYTKQPSKFVLNYFNLLEEKWLTYQRAQKMCYQTKVINGTKWKELFKL